MPSQNSIQSEKKEFENEKTSIILSQGIEFVCISYEKDIVEWLEKCVAEITDKPFIHAIINQYLILIKNLTNQPKNQNMKNELMQLLLSDNNMNNANTIKSTLHQINLELEKKLDNLAKIFKNNSIFINSEIYKVKFQPKFKDNGNILIHFEIFKTNSENNKNSVFIQLRIEDYKLYNKIWSYNKELKEILRQQLDNNYQGFEHSYAFEITAQEIYDDVKLQINKILTIIEQ